MQRPRHVRAEQFSSRPGPHRDVAAYQYNRRSHCQRDSPLSTPLASADRETPPTDRAVRSPSALDSEGSSMGAVDHDTRIPSRAVGSTVTTVLSARADEPHSILGRPRTTATPPWLGGSRRPIGIAMQPMWAHSHVHDGGEQAPVPGRTLVHR